MGRGERPVAVTRGHVPLHAGPEQKGSRFRRGQTALLCPPLNPFLSSTSLEKRPQDLEGGEQDAEPPPRALIVPVGTWR